MRKSIIQFCSIIPAVAVGITLLSLTSGYIPIAQAQDQAQDAGLHGGSPGVHQSILQISEKTLQMSEKHEAPLTKSITLSRNKSLMLELPRRLRDVIVSNPEMVDAVVHEVVAAGDEDKSEFSRVYLIGKQVGQANTFFFDASGNRILTLEIQIEVDTRPLDEMLSRFIPNSRITTEALNDTLILTGTVRNPADSSRAEALAARFANTEKPQEPQKFHGKVINMLQVEGEEQVMLRVKFAEVQRTTLKQFGANVGGRLSNNSNVFQLQTQNLLPVTTSEGLSELGQIVSNGLPFTSNGLPFIGSGVGGAFVAAEGTRELLYTMRILERQGLMRTLAEPNLTAVSGESANFLAGGEFPIPVATDEDGVKVTFKEYGVGLAFTPVVMSEGRISLKISTEVSELSTNGAVTFSGIAIPALTKRKTESTVELPSGGTLAMSGLIQNNMQKNIDGYPGLKELPVLGALFRSSDFVNEETELVVIVTPYIVRPTAKKNFAMPTDGLAPADDISTSLLAHLNRIHGRSVSRRASSLKDSSYGFIVK